MNQIHIPFSPPDISDQEIKNIVEVMKSGWITTGPKTQQFESEIALFSETSKAVCLNSAIASMEMCLRLLGVGPGDEVITSSYTYTASASVIHHVGAKIVLVDVEPGSFILSMDEVEKAITPNTKAIIPVDIGGTVCDYDQLFEILEAKKAMFTPNNQIQENFGRVIVLADAAHSLGATYKNTKVGGVADFTSFSFHAVKNLTTGEGGALTWKSLGQTMDEYIYKTVKTLSLHGQTKDAFSKNELKSWEYDIVSLAYKCNMTDMQAGMGLAQLERYPDLLKQRKAIVAKYHSGLPTANFKVNQHENKNFESSCHLLLTNFSSADYSRNEFITKLAERGIATNVHYKPLPLLTAYKNLGFRIEDYPNAYAQFINEISFPLYSTLKNEDLDYIFSVVNDLLNNKRRIAQ